LHLSRSLDGYETIIQGLSDYCLDIGGRRAIAALSIFNLPLGATWMQGSFVGIHVFFVISGYLITKHLAEGISRNGHVVGLLLVRFYNKRILQGAATPSFLCMICAQRLISRRAGDVISL